MISNLLSKLRLLAKDEAAFNELSDIFSKIENEKNTAISHIDLIERAISNDYDSILITELSLEKPGPIIVYVNDGFTKLTGFSKEEAIGKTPRILQGPKTDRKTLDRLKESLLVGKSFFGQAVNYRKDGSEFINQWDIHPLYNKEGLLTHWVSYQHDITKRKAAEKTFNETEVEFDDLIEYSKRTLIDLDFSGKIIKANKSFRTLTGFDNAELTHHSFAQILEDGESTQFKQLISNPQDRNKFIFVLKTKNNIPIQVEVEAEIHSLKIGELIRLTVHNVSMQKNVLKTLEHKLFNFEALMSKKNEFNYEISFNEFNKPQFTYLSEGFESLTGYNAVHFLESNSLTNLFKEEDLEKINHLFEKVISGIDMVENVKLVHANGSLINVLNYAQIDLSEKELGKIRITGSIVTTEQNEIA
jgi:PAS domain S-box-containing protein